MQSAKDVNILEEFVKVMVIGDYGSGKSVFASSFPTPGFVFDFDKGIKTFSGLDFDYTQYDKTAKSWVQFEKDLREVRDAISEKKYKTVILDSTSSMTDIAMERAMQLDPKRSLTGGPLWNVHYQIVKNLMEAKLSMIIDLNCNIVLNSHINLTQDQETGAVLSADPLLTGQLASKIPGYFDEVYYATVKTKEGKPRYQLQTVTKGFWKARSRLSGKKQRLPHFIDNDYKKLVETLTKAIN